MAADAAFYSAKNEAAAKAKGVKRVCIPNRSTKSLERKREQRKRWFRNGQKWCTGSEGRISVVKRRHGLDRCRYRGYVGINRWVGLGVIAVMSSTSAAALSKGARPPNHSSIATLGKARRSSPAGFASPRTVDHSAERSILRREVASLAAWRQANFSKSNWF